MNFNIEANRCNITNKELKEKVNEINKQIS